MATPDPGSDPGTDPGTDPGADPGPDPGRVIFHICTRAEWRAAEAGGVYEGSSQDAADGFIHFSTAEQVAASAAKHRAGQRGLVLLTVDAQALGGALGAALRWEPARGGAPFPHLYGPLPLAAVMHVDDLPLGPDGNHVFPPGVVPVPDRERTRE